MERYAIGRKKRRETGRKLWSALLFFLFFPYLCSYFAKTDRQEVSLAGNTDNGGQVWVVQNQLWGEKKIPLEEYLEGMLAATIPGEYEPETLKAQAILLRSRCMSLAQEENGEKVISASLLEDSYLSPKQRRKLWQEEAEATASDMEEKIKLALEETAGLILTWEGEYIDPPFFRLGSGRTRNTEEYQEEYGQWDYVDSVECEHDITAEGYKNKIVVKETEFKRKLADLLELDSWETEKIILCRDEADYVKSLQTASGEIDGEDFRYAFDLYSSCFTLTQEGSDLVIETKGLGHGFGFDQYEANEQAKEGKNARELLSFFFSKTSLEKM
jgi:stage II sporulation protein D